jgi:hypothetical protein
MLVSIGCKKEEIRKCLVTTMESNDVIEYSVKEAQGLLEKHA